MLSHLSSIFPLLQRAFFPALKWRKKPAICSTLPKKDSSKCIFNLKRDQNVKNAPIEGLNCFDLFEFRAKKV